MWHIYYGSFSLNWMLLPGSSLVYRAWLISQLHLLIFIGFVLLSASISSWRQLRIDVSMVLHPATSLPTFVVLLTFRRVIGYVRPRVAYWTFVLFGSEHLVTMHFRLPPPGCGMNFQAMSLQLSCWLLFFVGLNCIVSSVFSGFKLTLLYAASLCNCG